MLLTKTMLRSIGLATCIAIASTCHADNVIDRLSSFDEARIEAIAPWAEMIDDEALAQEAAKLIYQVNRFARSGGASFAEKQIVTPENETGSVITIDGRVTSIDRWRLPASLAEVLEFEELYRVQVQPDIATEPVVVITSTIPKAWKNSGANVGFSTLASGVLLRPMSAEVATAIAAPSMAWIVEDEDDAGGIPPGWKLLGKQGYDLSLLEGVRARNRQPLREEDAAAFYPLLRTAASISDAGDRPSAVEASTLLKEATSLVGRYVSVDLQSIRITRIRASEPLTVSQLGSDHYWQLDAIADLGNVVIKIESENGASATFENRYPVSVAVRELPDFLMKTVAAQDPAGNADAVDVAMISTQVTVEGFFYRLWSYESDFMEQHGGGKQFGPLIIASRIIDREPSETDPVGVSQIGWYFAAMTIIAILATIVGSLYASKRDAAAKRKSRASMPDRIAP